MFFLKYIDQQEVDQVAADSQFQIDYIWTTRSIVKSSGLVTINHKPYQEYALINILDPYHLHYHDQEDELTAFRLSNIC